MAATPVRDVDLFSKLGTCTTKFPLWFFSQRCQRAGVRVSELAEKRVA
jgi:hypothetical protein